ncbi:Bifunctional NAD(P)H-hydrate repair enzyme Nnr (Includes: ADP-dependent (S)-NAD(P)H-hydrate dehydratase; NAD(P)H-hydrate epimerase) [uncultured Desulfobacterium sp.]|uniref:Bifunctional NAD(P)H-hydrate repair enzyme n=1 Tax=uncultured Desulfobacterium sp. TaxID=201089 RepID=A0A445N457_9BACT|nr:Bifunctional NAD(P)H-hydrate repair enzyme Nnr (Includes: ADP-dependent (S)-NAD(P)H-hydrate dehydratase; NAD(P)H-hydrate epimerase) [uncultured Desulfobacterium sp.]
MKVSRVSEMRELDRTASVQFGIKEELLMENAGLATCSVIARHFGITGKRFIVFCGVGNNGGDGFVIARKIHSDGGHVKVFVLGNRDNFKGVAAMNLNITSLLPIEIIQVETADSIKTDISHCDAIVDAIFGTGLARDVKGIYQDVITLINESGKTVFSADIPSGVSGDTGNIMGTAVKADYTVSFGLPKIGNLLYPGYAMQGKLYTTHISFPRSIFTKDSLKIEINYPPPIPPRERHGHKGDFGDVLFIAGAAGYFGAPYFAAMSFMKAGGGYARLASPSSITPFIANKGSEIVFVPQKETQAGSISLENKDALIELSEKADMVVIGPGLSLNEETQDLVRMLAEKINKPILIDGDGITAICKDLGIIKKRKAETILTPHLGEMSRITNLAVSEVNDSKVDILQKTSKDLGAIIVLKGAHSLIGYPDERVFINMTGNSGMATAGSGDLLTGTIAAMFGLGMPLQEAVSKGVFIHGLAGDMAAMSIGEDGMTAQDILENLPLAVRADREGLDEELREEYFTERIV